MSKRNTVSAQAGAVPVETVLDQADNTFTNGTVQIRWLGDGDGDTNPANDSLLYGAVTNKIPSDGNWDKVVDISDAAMIGTGWGQTPGDPFYDNMGYKTDFNWDGILDISDAAGVGRNWGKSIPTYDP